MVVQSCLGGIKCVSVVVVFNKAAGQGRNGAGLPQGSPKAPLGLPPYGLYLHLCGDASLEASVQAGSVFLDFMVFRVFRVFIVLIVLRVFQVFRVFMVFRVFRVFMVFMVFRVLMV